MNEYPHGENGRRKSPPLYRFRWLHDWLCGENLKPGRIAGVAALPEEDDLYVLEVGVGSGLSLEHYPEGVRLIGIDPSADMIRGAENRKQKSEADVTLLQMSGEHLAFANERFDAVVLLNVVSVVEDVRQLLAEIHRVVRPGGQAIIVTAFHNRFVRALTGLLPNSVLRYSIGFHTRLRPEDITGAVGWEVREHVRDAIIKPNELFVLEKV